MNDYKLPMQPIYQDQNNNDRFVANKIVEWLLDNGSKNMNDIAIEFYETGNDDHLTQFAQLIGYSVNGFSELSYVSDEAFSEAVKELPGWEKESQTDE